MEKISLLSFIIQFCPLCNCHIRKTELANLHVSSSWSWNWGFPWDNEEEILGVLYTAIDAPAKSAVLPCSNNFMSVPSCSSVSCHPATLEPHLLLNVCINQFCVWCSLSPECWAEQKIAYGYRACHLSDLSAPVAFPSPWEAWCAASLQPTFPTQKCLFSSWRKKLK